MRLSLTSVAYVPIASPFAASGPRTTNVCCFFRPLKIGSLSVVSSVSCVKVQQQQIVDSFAVYDVILCFGTVNEPTGCTGR